MLESRILNIQQVMTYKVTCERMEPDRQLSATLDILQSGTPTTRHRPIVDLHCSLTTCSESCLEIKIYYEGITIRTCSLPNFKIVDICLVVFKFYHLTTILQIFPICKCIK